MSRLVSTLLASVVFLVAARAIGAPAVHIGARDEIFEQKIDDELRAIAPNSLSTFTRAVQVYDAGEFDEAARLYETVAKEVPSFVHAKRRTCGALLAAGKRTAALPFCRAALAQDDSPENEAALASALVATSGFAPSTGEVEEAKELAEKAAAAKPNEAHVWSTLFQVGMASGDRSTMRRSVDHLVAIAPDELFTLVPKAFAAASEGHRDDALEALDRAEQNGLSKEEHARLAALVEEMTAQPWYVRTAYFLGRAVAAWVLLFGFLVGAGFALSRATLRAVADRPTDAAVRPHELFLRRIYRALLVAASAFYYVSLPLVALLVVASVVGVIGGVLAAGWIAPKLFVIVLIVGASSILAIARGIFVRPKVVDPGITLDLDANPALRGVLAEVAARIGTRPVDRVYVTPFTDVAVFDRGGVVAQMRGASERCLVLGVGVLEGMRVCAFKSVLAHEYGHFRNEDTAGGDLALAVRRSLNAMTVHLINGRAASPVNPAWWFVRGFSRAFYGISQGASRLQEILADRWAAFAYGSSVFEEGLRHVIARDVRFGAHVGATLEDVVKNKRALPNLYAFAPCAPKGEPEIARDVDEALAKPASTYDSHPSPADRLAWVRALAAEAPPEHGSDDVDAWSLFANRQQLEAAMSDDVRARVQRVHGVVVSST